MQARAGGVCVCLRVCVRVTMLKSSFGGEKKPNSSEQIWGRTKQAGQSSTPERSPHTHTHKHKHAHTHTLKLTVKNIELMDESYLGVKQR